MANGLIRCQKRRPRKRFHKLNIMADNHARKVREQHGQIRSQLDLVKKRYEKEISVALRGLILLERNVSASR